MARKQKSTTDVLRELAEEYRKAADDIKAFMTGEIGPTQQEYIDKINADWPAYNFIVMFGHVYRLSKEKREKPNQEGVFYPPCEICELSEWCSKQEPSSFCNLMNADTDEYFRDEGELVIDKKGKMKVEPWFKT